MNIFHVDFEELYQRHLCRHGQFGINVWHIVAVYGIYFSICSLAAITIRELMAPLSIRHQGCLLSLVFTPYLAVLLRNIPKPVFALTVVSATFLIIAAVTTPGLPFWLHVILIPAWHRVQLLSHRYYTTQHDISPFTEKYRKGMTLFLILAIYELPILLQYLAYGRKNWID